MPFDPIPQNNNHSLMQQAFNIMVSHLRRQNQKAAYECGGTLMCRYRSDDGLKCAVGALIPDAFYDLNMEGKKASSLAEDYPELGWPTEGHFVCLLDDMQHIHDQQPEFIWEQLFGRVAREYQLTLPTERPHKPILRFFPEKQYATI